MLLYVGSTILTDYRKARKCMSKIDVLSTGGTFDKAYGSGAGVRDFSFPEVSAVDEIAARLGIQNVSVSYKSVAAMDSLDMTDVDRLSIADWCANESRERCVVIHGTDTMIETARIIAKRCSHQVVILTGALQPARMRDTDAEFNLGGALIAAQVCLPGVYIVMSGTIFRWDECQKNPITGHFEPLK